MIKSPFKILLIEGNSEDFQLVQRALQECDTPQLILEIAANLYDAFDLILNGEIDLILLDLSTPDRNGFEILEALRARSIALPIIVLTGKDDEEMGIKAVKEGAQDYLLKNIINSDSLTRSIRYAVERFKMINDLRIAYLRLTHRHPPIKEYKLKELLRMCNSTAHELNQPLTALLGNIYLMRIEKDKPEKFSLNMEKIENSGKKIAAIVKKLQTICHDGVNEHSKDPPVGDMPPGPGLHKIEHIDDNFKNLNNLFKIVQSRYNRTAV